LLFSNPPIFALNFLFYAKVFSILLVITVYDLKHKIIPDALVFFVGLMAFIGLFLFQDYSFAPHMPGIIDFLAGPILAIPFALLWLVSKGRWMGLGDAKLIVGLGWLLGLARGTFALMIAFWAGAIIGVALILLSKRYRWGSEIPFAPYLIAAALLVFFLNISLPFP
jgi:leader peptidase (prepilin peptidase)/N-methyltransferase